MEATTIRTTRKEHIYREAARLFRDKGYRATSMRDLAGSVGLEPSSLYSHIRSKQELLRKICFGCGERFLEGMEEITSADTSPSEAIAALIHLHVTIACEDVTAITVFNDEWRHLSEPDLKLFHIMRDRYEAAFETIIADGVADGEFRYCEPKLALNTLLSAVQWVYRKKHINPEDVDEIASAISGIFLNGLTHQA